MESINGLNSALPSATIAHSLCLFIYFAWRYAWSAASTESVSLAYLLRCFCLKRIPSPWTSDTLSNPVATGLPWIFSKFEEGVQNWTKHQRYFGSTASLVRINPENVSILFAYYFFGVHASVSNIDVYRLAGRKSVSGTSWCSVDEREAKLDLTPRPDFHLTI